jgi:anti-sigma B factor antagonist
MAANPIIPISSLSIDQRKSGDTVTLLCHGKVIAETTPILRDEVRRVLAESGTVVLDLTDVSYLDSSGLGALVGLYASAKRAGKQLKLINLSDRIKELLRITKLLSVFEGYGAYM